MRNTTRFTSIPLLVPLLTLLVGCAAIEAQKLAGDGSRLVQQNQPDQAVEKFEASIASSDNPAARAGLAEAYLMLGRYSEGEAEAKKAIDMSEGSLDTATDRYHLILARAYLLEGQGRDAMDLASKVVSMHFQTTLADPMSRRLAKEGLLLKVRVIEATGSPDQAAQQVNDEGIQLKFPDDLDFKAERAVVAALQRNNEEALKLADEVLAKNEDEGDALLAKGIVYATTGEVEKAKAILPGPLRSDNTRVMVFLRATQVLRSQQKNKEATELLELLAEIQPQSHLIHKELAFAYLDLGMYPESIREHEALLHTYPSIKTYAEKETLDEFKAALEANPPSDFDRKQMAGYYDNLGALYLQVGDRDKAIERLERAAATSARIEAFQALAGAYGREEKTTDAIRTLERALELEPENADVLKAIGALYFKSGDTEKAMAAMKASLEGRMDDPEAHLNLGVVFFNSEHYQEAAVEFDAASKLKPEDADVLYYLARAQLKLEQKKEAEQTLLRVVALKEDYADAYRELGNLAMERRDYKKADKYYTLQDKYSGVAPQK